MISFKVDRLIYLLSKGLSSLLQYQTWENISSSAICLLYCLSTHTCIHDYWKEHSLDYTDLCRQSDVFAFNTLSRFVIAFLPRSNRLLISWLQSPSTVILEPKKRKSVTSSTFSTICHDVTGPDAMILVFLILSFKQVFFTLLLHLHQETL